MPSADEVRVQKQIIEFFSSFEELTLAVKASSDRARTSAGFIFVLVGRQRLMRAAILSNTPIHDVLGNLLLRFDNRINQLVVSIREDLENLNERSEKLTNKYHNLQSSCRKINYTEKNFLVEGNCFQPPLPFLLEYAFDSTNYVSQICSQFDIGVERLGFELENTQPDIVDQFIIPEDWKTRVSEIIKYTSSCSQNTL